MATAPDKQTKRWTYEEYYRLEDHQRQEIIDGNLLMVPSQDLWHQEWNLNLTLLVANHVKRGQLGKVFVPPFDVVLDAENAVQPDLIFVATANLGIVRQRAIFGSPDLLVELISPFSVRRDRYDKQALYARFGVQEYWLCDPANKSLEILTLKDGRYELHCSAEVKGKLNSPKLPGLEFDVADLQVQ